MFNIKYNIDLNEHGRPCIDLSENYEHNPEDRFFSIELTRYVIQDLLQRRGQDVDENTIEVMDTVINFLGQIGDEMAEIIYGQMKTLGDVHIMIDNFYHVNVKTIEERDNLPDKGILYNGRIFDRVEGLYVQVNKFIDEESSNFSPYLYTPHDFMPVVEMYRLEDGITNDHWVRLSTEEINERLTRNNK